MKMYVKILACMAIIAMVLGGSTAFAAETEVVDLAPYYNLTPGSNILYMYYSGMDLLDPLGYELYLK